jgi:ABC-type branched-subunit amino acid transport system substrate-binding protein
MWNGVARNRQWSRLAPALLLLAFVLTSCERARPVVKIGLVAPFEGRERAVGYDAVYAARLAVREVSASQDEYDVELVALDDSGH